MNSILYGRQDIMQEDIDAVVKTLKSDFLPQGSAISAFEKAFYEYIGVKYAVAVSYGTAALHLRSMVFGVSAGDKVITAPSTFLVSTNCVKYCDGEVVFLDVDPKTQCLSIPTFPPLTNREQESLIGSINNFFK